MIVVGRALRLLVGLVIAWWLAAAAAAPEIPRPAAAMAVAVAAAALWRPGAALLLAAGLAPAGVLLAAPPARGAEMLAWAALAGWLLRVWKPLSPAAWPRGMATPAALYALMLVSSWVAVSIAGAAGVPPASWPRFLYWLLPPDHLVFSSPAPETATLFQALTGIGVFLAAIAAARVERRPVELVAGTLALSAAALALITVADLARQWADTGYGGWFLARYARGERFSPHFADLNAAGSVYVLSGLAAAGLAIDDARRRRLWIGAALAVLPALLLAGSVSAIAAGFLAGAAVLGRAIWQPRWQPTRRQGAVAATVVLIVCVGAAALAVGRTEGRASVRQAVALRGQFLETSARMFGSAPAFGVGVGRYFDRSAEFMPEGLRRFWGNENAHNYFAQQFAELGVAGGALFIWLLAAVFAGAWRMRRSADAGGAWRGLLAGASAYILTCLAGHPLLVSEAALPFWIALGALAGHAGGRDAPPARSMALPVAVAAIAVLAATHVGIAARAAARTAAPPAEQGFHGLERDGAGGQFRWMTRHAVTYVPAGPGVLTVRLRAPGELPRSRPLEVEIVAAGRPIGRRVLSDEAWATIDVGVRQPAGTPFRRIDLRANQHWTQQVALGERRAQRPISAMVGVLEWTPVNGER